MPSNAQLEQLAYELANRNKTIQTDVVKRFMTEAEYRKFMQSYAAHRKTQGSGGVSRFERMSRELTRQDLDVIDAYMNDEAHKIKEVAELMGIPKGSIHHKLYSAVLKLVYQNKSKLGI